MDIKRKSKESKPVLAICYDFDKTLSPDDMQAQGYIQSVVYTKPQFVLCMLFSSKKEIILFYFSET